MRVSCPKCNSTFAAKANARRIRCPDCGFRQDVPAEGLPTGRKGGEESFRVLPSANAQAAPARDMTAWWIAAAVALVALGVGWYFLANHSSGDGISATTACGQPVSGFPLMDAADKVVEVKTDKGCMAVEVYDAKSPVTAKNFESYVAKGYFDNTIFHRVAPGFVIQGGGWDTEGKAKTPDAGLSVNEAKTSGLLNKKYTLSMARGGPSNGDSQFFINLNDNTALDPSGGNPGYAVFGKVVYGTDVVDAIAAIPTTSSKGHAYCLSIDDQGSQGSCPVTPVAITSASLAIAASTSTSTSASPCPSLPSAPDAPAAPVELDFITAGVWNVCSTTESNFAWIHNNSTAALDYTWSLTGIGGGALPSGWTVSFATPSGAIATHGTVDTALATSRVTLTVPAGQAPGDYPVELRAGGAVRPVNVHVATTSGQVLGVNAHPMTHYDLRYADGRAVQEGDYCLKSAVTGYAEGVAGAAVGEIVGLVVPPPLAYGYGGQFGNGKMHWTTTITSASC